MKITYELSVSYWHDGNGKDENISVLDDFVDSVVGLKHGDRGGGWGSRDLHFNAPKLFSDAECDALQEQLLASCPIKGIGFGVGCEAWDADDEEGDNHDELNERLREEMAA